MRKITNNKSQITNKKRNYAGEIFVAFAVMLLLLAVLIGTASPVRAGIVSTIFGEFGGKIEDKDLNFCIILVPVGLIVIPVPIPFLVYEIGPPVPAEVYYVYGFSHTYVRHQRDVGAWVLGNYVPKADDLWRQACANRAVLPDADGIIYGWGTGCVDLNNCEKQP